MSSIYYHREYGQFIDLSGSEWLVSLTVAATTVVVATLSVVLLAVSILAISPQAATTQGGVVTLGQALETHTLVALQSGVRTLATACHNELLMESGREIHSLRSGTSQAQWFWAKRRLLRLQKLIYINTRTKRQGFLSKLWHKNTATSVMIAVGYTVIATMSQ